MFLTHNRSQPGSLEVEYKHVRTTSKYIILKKILRDALFNSNLTILLAQYIYLASEDTRTIGGGPFRFSLLSINEQSY